MHNSRRTPVHAVQISYSSEIQPVSHTFFHVGLSFPLLLRRSIPENGAVRWFHRLRVLVSHQERDSWWWELFTHAASPGQSFKQEQLQSCSPELSGFCINFLIRVGSEWRMPSANRYWLIIHLFFFFLTHISWLLLMHIFHRVIFQALACNTSQWQMLLIWTVPSAAMSHQTFSQCLLQTGHPVLW